MPSICSLWAQMWQASVHLVLRTPLVPCRMHGLTSSCLSCRLERDKENAAAAAASSTGGERSVRQAR